MITRLKIFESLKTARKKYETIIDEELGGGEFSILIALDPTSTYKYMDMICKYALEGIDFDDIKEYIELFHLLSSKDKLEDNDINNYKTFNDLKKIGEIDKTSRKDIEEDIRKDRKIIIDNDDILVFMPLSHRASCKYGMGTKWCVSAKNDKFFWYALNKRGHEIFFIIVKNKELVSKLDSDVRIHKGYSVGSSQGDLNDPSNFEKIIVLSSPSSGISIQMWAKSNHDVKSSYISKVLKILNIDKNIFKNNKKEQDISDMMEKNIITFEHYDN